MCLEVAPLALLTYKYHVPEVNTIVRIVHNETWVSPEMKTYQAKLEKAGATVVEWLPTGNMDCPIKSLFVR